MYLLLKVNEREIYNFKNVISVAIVGQKSFNVKIMKKNSRYYNYFDVREKYLDGLIKHLKNNKDFIEIKEMFYVKKNAIESITLTNSSMNTNYKYLNINYAEVEGESISDNILFPDKESAELAFLVLGGSLDIIDLSKN